RCATGASSPSMRDKSGTASGMWPDCAACGVRLKTRACSPALFQRLGNRSGFLVRGMIFRKYFVSTRGQARVSCRSLARLVFRALLVGDLRAEQCIDAPQFGKRLVRLGDLPLEMRDLLAAFFRGQLQPVLRRPAGLGLDHFADFGERETELLALDDQREPVAVLAAEDAPAAAAFRRKQPAAFIEPQRPVGQRELACELVDAVFGLGIAGLRG